MLDTVASTVTRVPAATAAAAIGRSTRSTGDPGAAPAFSATAPIVEHVHSPARAPSPHRPPEYVRDRPRHCFGALLPCPGEQFGEDEVAEREPRRVLVAQRVEDRDMDGRGVQQGEHGGEGSERERAVAGRAVGPGRAGADCPPDGALVLTKGEGGHIVGILQQPLIKKCSYLGLRGEPVSG